MLSTDTEADQDDTPQPKVTITTVHAAKGLEWPVVFIPAVEQGTFPSYRCTEAHEIDEERRLLYVAMTRAQNFLTMSHCQFRMMGGEENDKEASEFVNMVQKLQPNLLSANLPDVDLAVRRYMSKMLARAPPDEERTKEMIKKHVRAAPPLSTWDAPEPRDKWSNRFARREVTKATRAAEYWASESDEYALPSASNPYAASAGSGFTSARKLGLGKPSRNPGPNSSRSEAPEKKEPVKIKSANKNIPAPIPFTFGQPDPTRPDADLGTFTSGSNASLAMMATLGLPPDLPGFAASSSGPLGGSSSLQGSGDSNDRNSSKREKQPVAKSLLSNVSPRTAASATASSRVQDSSLPNLNVGVKRLGMGRPSMRGFEKRTKH
ncbi:hypothetical protein IAU60_000787 [Kwoniella sp. DSM 27419]